MEAPAHLYCIEKTHSRYEYSHAPLNTRTTVRRDTLVCLIRYYRVKFPCVMKFSTLLTSGSKMSLLKQSSIGVNSTETTSKNVDKIHMQRVLSGGSVLEPIFSQRIRCISCGFQANFVQHPTQPLRVKSWMWTKDLSTASWRGQDLPSPLKCTRAWSSTFHPTFTRDESIQVAK